MFGLFRSTPDQSPRLISFMTDRYGMTLASAYAFVQAYKLPLNKMLQAADEQIGRDLSSSNPEVKMLAYLAEPEKIILGSMARTGYMYDLMRGKHVGTPVEFSILAVLHCSIEYIDRNDRALARFLRDTMFPRHEANIEACFVREDT